MPKVTCIGSRNGRAALLLAAAIGTSGLLAVPAGAEAACTHRLTTVASPNPRSFDELFGVASASQTDAWAVGLASGSTGSAWLVVHWDGAAWRTVPGPPAPVSPYSSVGIDSRGQVWIAGLGAVMRRSPTGRWRVFAVPANGRGLAVVGPTSVWASDADGNFLHWNGRAWNAVAGAVDTGGWAFIEAMGRIPTGGLWAVGADAADQTLAERWNGVRWRRVATPSPNPDGDGLAAVVAAGPAGAFAVGEAGAIDDEPWSPLVLRWDGDAWTQVASSSLPAGMDVAELLGAGLVTASDAWAVGTGSPISEAPTVGLLAHVTSEGIAFTADSSAAQLFAIAIDPGRRTGWVVGDRTTTTGGGTRSLIQRACGL